MIVYNDVYICYLYVIQCGMDEYVVCYGVFGYSVICYESVVVVGQCFQFIKNIVFKICCVYGC